LYVAADGAAIRRNPPQAIDFASLGMVPTGTLDPTNIVLSTGDFNYDFRAAGRLLVGLTLNQCLQIEGVYTGVSQSDNLVAVRDATPNGVSGQGMLFSPFGNFGSTPIVGLDYNNFAQIRYLSSLQSAELNIRRQVPLPPERMAVSILFGVRYIALPESFQYDTLSDVSTVQGTAAATSIHVATNNQMVGPQIGALFEFYTDNRWWINVELKAALMNNHSQQSTNYHNVGGGTGIAGDHVFRMAEDHTAFAGELNLTFVYRWSPHFSTRFGYQALWLEGMALAPDNLNSNVSFLTQGPAQLNRNSGTVYHGPLAGITLAW
jgi:hypothetical protein